MNFRHLVFYGFVFVILAFCGWYFFNRRSQAVIVEVPHSFAQFQKGNLTGQQLLNFLMKSRCWRVQPSFEGFRCELLCAESLPFSATGRKYQIGAVIKIGESTNTSVQDAAAYLSVSQLEALEYKINCLVKNEAFAGRVWRIAEIDLELAPGIYLGITEYDASCACIGIKALLNYLDQIFRCIQERKETCCLLIEDSIRYSSNTVDFVHIQNAPDSVSIGLIDGWVNFGEPGMLDLRWFDPQTGEEVNTAKRFRTREFVGWDLDKTQKFRFSTKLCVAGDRGKRNLDLVIYFHPITNLTQEIKMFSTNVLIQTWHR